MSELTKQGQPPPNTDKARFLKLSSQLIGEAVNEALQDIGVLTTTLLKLASTTNKLSIDEDPKKAKCKSEAIDADIKKLSQKAVGQLQFADRMQQRLDNVANNLEHFARLQLNENPKNWENFLLQARGEFTMESERVLFDELLGPMYKSENWGRATEKIEKPEQPNIDLF